MIRTVLDSLEDRNRPLLAPNCWFLKKICLLLPNSKVGKFFYILIHAIATYFVLSQYVELYEIRSNMDLALTNLKISMLSVICVIKANTFVFWQKSWKEVIDYVTEADKFERENQDITRGKIIASYTRYCRRLTYFYWALVFTTFLTTCFQPLLRYLSSPTFREDFRNGTEGFPHIFSSWMPLDKEHFPGTWVTVVWHILICAYGASVVAAYDSCIVVIMVFFGGKLDLLRIRCQQMVGSEGVSISDGVAASVLRELHQMHMLLIKYSRLFNSMLSPVMFFYMVMCSLMLCASAYQLTSAVNNSAQKLLMAEYLVFGIAQLFVFCWHSNDVLVKNENVTLGPYESNWWTASLQQKKGVMILSGQLCISNIFTAGPFTNLTLATFITILKGAYSYYTLLRK